MGTPNCEIAVVGSGPGGAVTACTLAEAGKDVLLIEEGPALPLSSSAPFSLDEMKAKYRNGGVSVAFGPSKIAYVEGRVLGGGSEINSALYHRTPAAILGDWSRRFEVQELSEKSLAQHFDAGEKDLTVSKLPGPAPEASLRFERGALSRGLKTLETPRMFAYSGGPGADGRRQSMSATYIPRARAAGAKILTDRRVERLRRGPGGWRLETRAISGQTEPIGAKHVFLCCGAVQTPALLRRSAVGRNIGESLSLHPTIKVIADFGEPVNSETMGVPVHQAKDEERGLSFGCSISSPPHLALALTAHPARLKSLGRDWRDMATYYAMVPGGDRGTVRCVPGFRDALVRYPLGEETLAKLTDGVRILSELLFAAGAKRLYPIVLGSGPFERPADVKSLPARIDAEAMRLMTIHLFASAPMGEDRSVCAADSFGRMHEQEGLYISDASLLCGSPGVNPQGTIMALARRNALRFLGKG